MTSFSSEKIFSVENDVMEASKRCVFSFIFILKYTLSFLKNLKRKKLLENIFKKAPNQCYQF